MASKRLTLEDIDKLLSKRLQENNKNLATKQDLVDVRKGLASKKDLKNSEKRIMQEIADNNKEMIEAVENYLSRYPTKDEYYTQEDKMMGVIEKSVFKN